ncbi:IclR family transcriptional regulator [Actinomadura syzygii]|uniref:IclR family transcriptional regulator n=1 Tax=Actinomadura syzygii TaxID=1427538 RepID=A0A5D0TSF5_9ACTN|nr:IclR family transcriptional regulator [Actinomadura syzygii]TYC08256.1 IclR family transcriptional regulator [Actinomadura syzygii]
MSTKESPVASVDRALRIIQLLSESGRGVTLEDLAVRSGIPRSSLHRLLGALRHRGFASQPEPNGPYFLGSELLAAAFRFYDRIDLRSLVHPVLLRLREELNETTHMAVLDGPEIVYVDKVEAIHPITMTSVIGGRNPAHCTGVGKALLAWTYPTDEAIKLWASTQDLRAVTRNTITSPARLAEEMAAIRERGYALDLEENEEGVRCAAVPVFLGRGVPSAGVSVTAPKDRFPKGRLTEVAVRLQAVLAEELDRPAG